MPNQSGKILLVLALLLLVLGAAVYFFLPGLNQRQLINDTPGDAFPSYNNDKKNNENLNSLKDYSSEDLKISFKYPQKWFIEEKYYFIMITSYATKFSGNQQPTGEQVEIDIHNYNGGCHKTIDENLKDPACGEGGSKIKPNEILSKETEDINGAKFYKYVMKYPSGKEQNFYFLEKGDIVLQIDKSPDPSQFESEFEQLIQSIQFNKNL